MNSSLDDSKFCAVPLEGGRPCGNMERTHETDDLGHPFMPTTPNGKITFASVEVISDPSAPPFPPEPEDEPDRPRGEKHRGQLRMAQRLASQQQGRLMHVHRLGWFVWDGTRWKPDDDGAPLRAVRDTIDHALVELRYLEPTERDKL